MQQSSHLIHTDFHLYTSLEGLPFLLREVNDQWGGLHPRQQLDVLLHARDPEGILRDTNLAVLVSKVRVRWFVVYTWEI